MDFLKNFKDSVGRGENVEGISGHMDNRGDTAFLVFGNRLLQPVPRLVHDVPLVQSPRRRRPPRTIGGVVLGASDNLGHVLLEKLLTPR